MIPQSQDRYVSVYQAQDLAFAIFNRVGGFRDEVLYRFMELLSYMGKDSDQLLVSEVERTVHNYVQAVESGDASILTQPRGLRVDKIVDVQEFVESKFFMGQRNAVRPKVLEKLWQLFHEDKDDSYLEVVLAGAIGWGKSYFSEMGLAYLIYKLSCFHAPQLEFGLAPGSTIVFVMQSIKLDLAKKVLFGQLGQKLRDSPYFTKYFPFDPGTTSEMKFPNSIILMPLSSSDTSALGLNVFGGTLDELNFMARIEKSTKSKFTGEEEYDQAEKLYSTILRRMKSRFNVLGKVPGKVFLISSANYPGDFTDRKIAEREQHLAETGKTSIFLAKMSQWEALPADRLSKETFLVEVGDAARRSRFLKTREDAIDQECVLEIPVDYLTDFKRDLEGSIRDLAGIPVGGSNSFIKSREHIVAAARAHVGIFEGRQLFIRDSVDLSDPRLVLEELIDETYLQSIAVDSRAQYAAHVDLALTGDSCGISIGHFAGYKQVGRALNWDEDEKKYVPVEAGEFPVTIVDGVLEVIPPLADEIDINMVGDLLEVVAQRINLVYVTADSFQSASLLQRARKIRNLNGRLIRSAVVSMDTDIAPYCEVKQGLRDGRLLYPDIEKLQRELRELMLDPIRKKIDHPPTGSKDLSDAVGGVTFVTMRLNAKIRKGRGALMSLDGGVVGPQRPPVDRRTRGSGRRVH